MTFRFFEIDEKQNAVVAKSSIPPGSMLARCLAEIDDSETDAELVIKIISTALKNKFTGR